MLVNGAAGAVGSIVGQIAKIKVGAISRVCEVQCFIGHKLENIK